MKKRIKINNKFKVFYYYTNNNNSWIRNIIRVISWIFTYNFSFSIEGNLEESKDIFVLSMTRNDYIDLFRTIYLSDSSTKSLVMIKTSKRFSFSLIPYFFKYLPLFSDTKAMRDDTENNEYQFSLLNRWKMYVMFISYIRLFDQLNLTESVYLKRLIVLADSWNAENVLIDMCKNNKIETVCCQHGLFIDNIGEKSIDKLNYYQLNADYYLTWGEATEKLLRKYNEDVKIEVCGNPIIKYSRNNTSIDMWGIICDQPRYHDYNQKLIRIVEQVARKKNKKIFVRLHPQEFDETNTYLIDESITQFERDVDKCEMIFGHTSTMLYTYLRQGYPTYKYKTDIKSNEYVDDLTFTDYEDLLKKINSSKNINYDNLGSYFVKYIDFESIEMYQRFFNG